MKDIIRKSADHPVSMFCSPASLLRLTLLSFIYFCFIEGCNSTREEDRTVERVISKDGTAISFVKSGDGPPLILVHGTTADHTRWDPLLPFLEGHFTVYAVDRRARGGSGGSPGYKIQEEGEDIAAVINSIDVPVYILGHSHGAICTLEAALLTKNIRKIALYEPPLPLGDQIYPPGAPGRMQELIKKGKSEAALELFFREVVRMPEKEFEMYSKLPVYKTRITLAPTIPGELQLDTYYKFDPERFRELKVPVLVMLGGSSPPIFSKAARALTSALPEADLKVFDNQQHIVMDTNPELFTNELLTFFNENFIEAH